jgi:hypothetical protein
LNLACSNAVQLETVSEVQAVPSESDGEIRRGPVDHRPAADAADGNSKVEGPVSSHRM